jgi:glycosyltransferase involved in cell wall biosynthesis
MARELKAIGWDVTVYSTIDAEYDDNGVKYIPFYKFQRNDEFNVLIGWRNNMASQGIKAKKHIVWLHDFVRASMFPMGKCDTIHKIIVLSDYHKSMLPEHVKHLAYMSTNGINPSDFIGHDIKRKKNRIIYASCYQRGLEILVNNWAKIREAVPTAELHAYYGWDLFDDYAKQGITDPAFKEYMLKMFKQDGIYEHGKIGHKQLIKEYLKSAVYAYPCTYPGEINCIALTKAIACNCNVVTNKQFVMAERSPNQVDDDAFIDAVIAELKKSFKHGINQEYIDSMSWKNVAKDWNDNLLTKGA